MYTAAHFFFGRPPLGMGSALALRGIRSMRLERHAGVTTRPPGKVIQSLVEFAQGVELLGRYVFARLSHHAADRTQERLLEVVEEVRQATSEGRRFFNRPRFCVDVVPFCRLRAHLFAVGNILDERLRGK